MAFQWLKKKHIKSFTVFCSAAVLTVIGSVMAYFTSTDAATNRFIGGRFDITLTETKWDPQNGREVVPGDELDKNPQVINNERTPGYIFLKVTVPCDTQKVDNDDGTEFGKLDSGVPLYKFMVNIAGYYFADETFTPNQTVNSHWSLVTAGNEDYTFYDLTNKQYVYVYAYALNGKLTPVEKGETTEPLFDKLQLWNFDESYDPDLSHSVTVEALGIQADLAGYSADQIGEIWAILSEGGGG